ncbi:MAG TPA: hypothetical protein DCP40_13445 [Stenotrophomonas sp.]|nr:hypothetical protein [Stenotrophomonas sp.]
MYAVSFVWTGMWLILQIVLLYQRQYELINGLPQAGSSGLAGFPLSIAIAGMAPYFIVMLLLHVAFAWANASAFNALLSPRLRAGRRLPALLIQLFLVSMTISFVAAWLYPESVAGDALGLVLLRGSARTTAIALALVCIAYFSTWLVIGCRRSGWMRAGLASVVALALLPALNAFPGRGRAPSVQKPDVIIVGIDSLRPDHLHRNHAPFRIMPNLEAVLDRSVIFEDTLTPQPHTSPATMSVLTGQWPAHSGARGNLFPVNTALTSKSMAFAFDAAGYDTVFAMDETRFANIDQDFGFQRILSPGMGVSEMLLGVLGDNVLSNLMMAAPVSRLLTPNVYGNRAHASVYRPEAFSRLLSRGVRETPADKPLFMYVHFCMGHWPYEPIGFFEHDQFENLPAGQFQDSNRDYLRAISTADRQAGRLLDDLRRAGRLDNAIVVLMSDHGEDFDMSKDVWPPGEIEVPGGIVNGHGGSAIRSPQTSVLLSFAGFGRQSIAAAVRTEPASLIDIAPTLISRAGVRDHVARDGYNLLDDGVTMPGRRLRFVESSYFPGSLRKSSIDEAAVLREMASMYQVNDLGRVEVKPKWKDFQISRRQRAVYLDGWVLMAAEIPEDGLLLINRADQKGWKLKDAPEQAPVQELRKAWCEHWSMDDTAALFCGSDVAMLSAGPTTASLLH